MKLELSLHAKDLKNVAGAFKGTSDPFAVVTQMATTPGSKPKVLGKTEVIKNNLSPNWIKLFDLDYELGTPVKVIVSLYDEVRKSENIPMGSVVFDIGELLGARGNTKAKKLRDDAGTVFAMVRKAQGAGALRITMKGFKLKNVEGWIGKSDPFYELSRKVDAAGGQTWDNVHRSEVVKDNLNPVWKANTVELGKLCGGDLDAPILVSVFDYESKGSPVPMGSFETSVNGLLEGKRTSQRFTLKQKGKDVGTIMVTNAMVSGQGPTITTVDGGDEASDAVADRPIALPPAPALEKANFVDYVTGGCNLNVTVAIDFTGSNGDPRKPESLHYFHREDPVAQNDYEKAISAIVSILSKYDTDQMYPVVGFGAKYSGEINHCFQCGPTEEVHGVKGVLEAYHQVFNSGLVMSGPTVFSEVIEVAASKAISAAEAASARGSQSYSILLILTDGAVSNAMETSERLRQSSHAPLSVVIVGLGTADFTSMQFLDDAAGPGQRDIAQFVEFNKHSGNSVQLTSETLKEIPNQLVGHFRERGLAPLEAKQVDDEDIVVEPEEEEIDLSLDMTDDEIVVTGGGNGFVDGFKAGI